MKYHIPRRKVKAIFQVHYTSFSVDYDVWWLENGLIQPDDGKVYRDDNTLVYDQFIHAIYNEGRRVKQKNPNEKIEEIRISCKDYPDVSSKVSANTIRGVYTNPKPLQLLLESLQIKDHLQSILPDSTQSNNKAKVKL